MSVSLGIKCHFFQSSVCTACTVCCCFKNLSAMSCDEFQRVGSSGFVVLEVRGLFFGELAWELWWSSEGVLQSLKSAADTPLVTALFTARCELCPKPWINVWWSFIIGQIVFLIFSILWRASDMVGCVNLRWLCSCLSSWTSSSGWFW